MAIRGGEVYTRKEMKAWEFLHNQNPKDGKFEALLRDNAAACLTALFEEADNMFFKPQKNDLIRYDRMIVLVDFLTGFLTPSSADSDSLSLIQKDSEQAKYILICILASSFKRVFEHNQPQFFASLLRELEKKLSVGLKNDLLKGAGEFFKEKDILIEKTTTDISSLDASSFHARVEAMIKGLISDVGNNESWLKLIHLCCMSHVLKLDITLADKKNLNRIKYIFHCLLSSGDDERERARKNRISRVFISFFWPRGFFESP